MNNNLNNNYNNKNSNNRWMKFYIKKKKFKLKITIFNKL